MTTPS
jgi:hypothetical protein